MPTNRRQFIQTSAFGVATLVTGRCLLSGAAAKRPLFDGKSLAGWHAVPRLSVPTAAQFAKIPTDELKQAVIQWHETHPELKPRLAHTGHWEVKEGAIIGGHEPADSSLGAYLLSDQKFSDFELELEARPDWPVDTGVMIRAHELGSVGFQILLDHRPKGGIGGVFGNSLGNFLAAPFTLAGDKAAGFRVENLRAGEPEANFKSPVMNYAASFADFAKIWHPNEWNHFRIRCAGRLPLITTWINSLKICELDTAKIDLPGYDAETVFTRIGRAGHIGFEVHDVNLKNPLGQDRWGIGAVCRWRNIMITEL